MKRITKWTVTQKPRYIHDCSTCIFLGHYKEYDLYACGKDLREQLDAERDMIVTTVLARFSSTASEYRSGAVFAFTGGEDQSLKVALARCIYMNYMFDFSEEVKRDAWRLMIEPMMHDFAVETE